MRKGEGSTSRFSTDRGVSILLIAASMVFILGMAGLGVDLASLYVARNQAQRSADAAALAGAQWWATHACTSSTLSSTISLDCQNNAKLQAKAVGEKNPIAGVTPDIDMNTDITFPSLSTNDPQIRVVVARNTAHNNAMPTFFVKIFGITTANVAASATAEAYNATNASTPVGSKCVKPWLLPDCDPNTASTAPNPNCGSAANPTGGYYYADPNLIGQVITIKPGDPTSASGPSEFFPVWIQGDTPDASTCPTCTKTQTSSGSQSGDLYRESIECCIQNPVVCGTDYVNSVNGNMVGPTDQGVQCLIQQGNGNSGGQDTYDPTTGIITAGTNNRYGLTGQISNSDSIITIPIYDGQILCPGGSNSTSTPTLCQSSTQVQVTGFMKVFIQQVGAPQASVSAYVMDLVHCSSGGANGGGTNPPPPIIAAAGTDIPVRLIHQ